MIIKSSHQSTSIIQSLKIFSELIFVKIWLLLISCSGSSHWETLEIRKKHSKALTIYCETYHNEELPVGKKVLQILAFFGQKVKSASARIYNEISQISNSLPFEVSKSFSKSTKENPNPNYGRVAYIGYTSGWMALCISIYMHKKKIQCSKTRWATYISIYWCTK